MTSWYQEVRAVQLEPGTLQPASVSSGSLVPALGAREGVRRCSW